MVEHGSLEPARVRVVAATLVEAEAVASQLDSLRLRVEALTADDGLLVIPAEVDVWVVVLPPRAHPLRDVLKASGAPPRQRWLCLVEASDTDGRTHAYNAGAGDVLIQPVQAHELQFRLDQLLNNSPRLLQSLLEEKQLLSFLRGLIDQRVTALEPVMHPLLPCGHLYPQAAALLGEAGCPPAFLEQLAEQGMLTRQMVNRLRTCATCGSIHLNYREVCPECTSVTMAEEEMIHHFSCAYVGPLAEFRSGLQLECPKCHTALRHIGLDYEKPARQTRCLACRAVFSEAEVQAQCLTCGSLWAPGETLERLVYRYELTALAQEAVSEGRVRGVNLEAILRSRQTGLHSRQFFHYELERELARFQRYKTPYSMIGIRLDGWKQIMNSHASQAEQYANSIYQAISHRLRMLDTTCVWNDDMIFILLSDTPEGGGHVVARRMHENVQGLEFLFSVSRPKISVSLLSSVAELKTADSLIEAILRDLNA